ncbi:hypothetical protein ONZ45_g12174 [Pleurotus djamor]|nr:hypothetical protein ONZ45_g12174 [Pleurotus djamor]
MQTLQTELTRSGSFDSDLTLVPDSGSLCPKKGLSVYLPRINANLTGFQLTRSKTKPETRQETWKSGESFPIPFVFIDYPPIIYYFS